MHKAVCACEKDSFKCNVRFTWSHPKDRASADGGASSKSEIGPRPKTTPEGLVREIACPKPDPRFRDLIRHDVPLYRSSILRNCSTANRSNPDFYCCFEHTLRTCSSFPSHKLLFLIVVSSARPNQHAAFSKAS